MHKLRNHISKIAYISNLLSSDPEIIDIIKEKGIIEKFTNCQSFDYYIERHQSIFNSTDIVKLDRVLIHNCLLFSSINKCITSINRCSISQKDLFKYLEIYRRDPKELKSLFIQKIKAAAINEEQRRSLIADIDYVFDKALVLLRQWIDVEETSNDNKAIQPLSGGKNNLIIPEAQYCQKNSEKITKELVECFIDACQKKSIEINMQEGANSALLGCKRVSITYKINEELYQNFVQLYLLNFAVNPEKAEQW